MSQKLLPFLGFMLLTSSCLLNRPSSERGFQGFSSAPHIQIEQFQLVDSVRHRTIPIVAYFPSPEQKGSSNRRSKLKIALLNHGYGGKNTDYAFLAANLVAHGYYVASLQQDLPGDAPMPKTGDIYKTRYPYWNRGAQNILFTLQALKQRDPTLDTHHVLLMGHSNGGDMVMLFAQEHPELVQKVISFDNRRVAFPRKRHPQILSLRSSDQPADPGVLPTPAEQTKFGMRIIKLRATIHDDMWDGATEQQKQEMNAAVSQFIDK